MQCGLSPGNVINGCIRVLSRLDFRGTGADKLLRREGVREGSREEEEDGTRGGARHKEAEGEEWEALEAIFFSFKCLFASVNLNTSFCNEAILDSVKFGSLEIPIEICVFKYQVKYVISELWLTNLVLRKASLGISKVHRGH